MIRGIDISSLQGPNLDWRGIAAMGIRFVAIRCGYGNEAPDRLYAQNKERARAAGLLVLPYHVLMPLPDDATHPGRSPEAQAKAFYEASGEELSHAIDFEWPWPPSTWPKWGCSAQEMRDHCYETLDELGSLAGAPPLLYNGFPDFWRAVGGHGDPRFAAFPLWDVIYPWGQHADRIPADGESPPAVAPWAGWSIWQHCGGGVQVPQLGGGWTGVDGDVIADEAALLQLFALPRVATTPPPQSP